MEREINRQNLRDIYKMLMEIAKGNFAYKIDRTSHNDVIEALSVQLNMMAEELRENFNHLTYVAPHLAYQHLVVFAIILDRHFNILFFTRNTSSLLGKNEDELNGYPFSNLLSDDSLTEWENIKQKFDQVDFTQDSFDLEYKTSNQLLIPSRCSVSRLSNNNKKNSTILITFFQTVLQQKEDDLILREKSMSKWDVRVMQEIHDYIFQNLDKPLPPIRELAHKYGINEHKLKKGFNTLFGTSPFKYYNNLRMEEARALIRNTNLPLEAVASKLGYKSYPHFSLYFKKRFGHSPLTYQKNIS